MRNHWTSLRLSFERTALRKNLHTDFLRTARAEVALASFDDVAELLACLRQRDGAHSQRDGILRALVRLLGDPCARELATALLWLALWPGLDAVYHRRLRCVRGADDDLTSSIAACFTALVGALDLSRVQRLAATLVRSTERDVLHELRRTWREQRVHVLVADDRSFDVGPSAGLRDVTQEALALRDELCGIVGADDADMLVAVIVVGEAPGELAVRLGISTEAARKRVQRGIARVRRTTNEIAA